MATEPERMRLVQLRWLIVCAISLLGALAFALLLGDVPGDILAFVIAVAIGWMLRMQWASTPITSRRRTTRDDGVS